MYVPSDLALENEILIVPTGFYHVKVERPKMRRKVLRGHESKFSLFINAKRYFLRDALRIY